MLAAYFISCTTECVEITFSYISEAYHLFQLSLAEYTSIPVYHPTPVITFQEHIEHVLVTKKLQIYRETFLFFPTSFQIVLRPRAQPFIGFVPMVMTLRYIVKQIHSSTST